MNGFSKNVKFQKSWRPYQARVLEELKGHLGDNHLHVIAAPGSGKTVLGLEVMIRLNKPTLILAPTLAIRDQWMDRFECLFLPPGQSATKMVSKNIKSPKLVTVSTYQGLYSAYRNTYAANETEQALHEEEVDVVEGKDETKTPPTTELLPALLKAGISTIIVDEAHHLRNEWWKCLFALVQGLGNPTIIALTATPPYDVTPFEWDRYRKLCGPVDAEIAVPELVREKNLCPHQDYIYFSTPLKKENEEIGEFRESVAGFAGDFCSNPAVIELISGHPHIVDAKKNIEAILTDPGFYSSIAVFLKRVKDRNPKGLLNVLGINESLLPGFDLETLEILLTGCFYTHAKELNDPKGIFKGYQKRLGQIGAIERGKVLLRSNKRVAKLLVSSISKLDSVGEIVNVEERSLRDGLRMVILTDYICKTDLPGKKGEQMPLKRIGVVPIFEKLRREDKREANLGVLTGTLVVIPTNEIDALYGIAKEMGIKKSSVKTAKMSHDGRYSFVEISGADKHAMVRVITELFNRGGIRVLIGTTSLLGEGWDAPSVNSLVLASFVASYVLSKQMRGRAIRSQEGNPDKTANIWHLVCVESGRKEPSDDLEMAIRRFKAFVGVSFKELIIENGIGRLNIGPPPFNQDRVEAINTKMKERALDREGLRREWNAILSLGDKGMRLTEEVRSTRISLPRRFVFQNTILALFWQSIFAGGAVLEAQLRGVLQDAFRYGLEMMETIRLVGFAFVAAAAVALPYSIKALYLLIKHGPVSSSIKQIGEALLESMVYAKLIKTPASELRVEAACDKYGIVRCSLVGGTTYELSLFLEALQEILGPIENPRYILLRKSFWRKITRHDYHVVPLELARKKEYAEHFRNMWRKYVGRTKLIFTRSIEGRKLLLKARVNAMSTSFQRKAERAKVWK